MFLLQSFLLHNVLETTIFIESHARHKAKLAHMQRLTFFFLFPKITYMDGLVYNADAMEGDKIRHLLHTGMKQS
jgi:hypothetical protein